MATIQEILTTRLNNIKSRIIRNMTEQKRMASGRSAASLRVEVQGNHGILWGAKSFLSMERGRGAGKIPLGFVAIIKQWAIDKGISVSARSKLGKPMSRESALNSFAGAVAYSIMKKGTRLHRSRKYDDIFTTVLNEELEKMGEDLNINLLDKITGINESAE